MNALRKFPASPTLLTAANDNFHLRLACLNRLSTIQNANLVTALTLTYDAADRVQTRTDSQG